MRRLENEVTVLDQSEMDQVDWSTVRKGCFYLTADGQILFELGHAGYIPLQHPSHYWDLFVSQKRYYQRLPERIVSASRSQDPQCLIGGRQFFYVPQSRTILPSNVGILPWSVIEKRGLQADSPGVSEVRRGAYDQLWEALENVAERLGATNGLFPTAVIADEKMARYGCQRALLPFFHRWLFKLTHTFPLRGVQLYVKYWER